MRTVLSCEWDAVVWLEERIGGGVRGRGQAFCQPLILGYWLLFILWLQSFRAAVGKIRPASGNRCLCLCVCGVGKGGGLVCLSDSVVFWKWVNKVFEEEQNKKLKNSQYIPAPIVWQSYNLRPKKPSSFAGVKCIINIHHGARPNIQNAYFHLHLPHLFTSLVSFVSTAPAWTRSKTQD